MSTVPLHHKIIPNFYLFIHLLWLRCVVVGIFATVVFHIPSKCLPRKQNMDSCWTLMARFIVRYYCFTPCRESHFHAVQTHMPYIHRTKETLAHLTLNEIDFTTNELSFPFILLLMV